MNPFKNPLSPKEKKADKSFAAPSKDRATTGRFMEAGDEYGVGHRTPVGKDKPAPYDKGPVPMSCGCYDANEIFSN